MESLIAAIAEAAELDTPTVTKILVKSEDTSRGDYALPCFTLAKLLKQAPPACASALKEKIKLPSEFEKVEAVGPYLNFFLKRGQFAKQIVLRILNEGVGVGQQAAKNETLIVEYSAPNIAKNLHVGHMRTTLIGLSLERIYKKLGYKVVTINHLGDWGVQFGYIWAGCELWGKPEKPSIDSLVDLYVKASNLKKAQEENNVPADQSSLPDVSEMARGYFIRLENSDAEALKFWQWCLDLSLLEFKQIYERLDIHFDHYTGESFYRDQIEDIEELVRKSGILQESRGALGVDLGKDLGFARIFADDGRSLYITRDIAAAIYREKTYSPAKIFYVVAAQQSLHFKQLIEILRRMKEPVADKMVHVSFGFVPGMKTREGSTILFKDFLSEAHSRALQTYREEVSKRPEGLNEEEIAEKVAIGGTYFYFLKHSNIKDFNFSWKEALNFQGDSGAYVQYSLARMHSIERKANEAGILSDVESLCEFDEKLLQEPVAYELVSLLGRFPQMIEKAGSEHEPSYLASYALDLAKSFAKSYNTLRVVGEKPEVAKARMALFVACRNVLCSALALIGVPTVEKM